MITTFQIKQGPELALFTYSNYPAKNITRKIEERAN